MQAWTRAKEIWASGGWAMIPLAATAFILYWKAADMRIALWRKNYETHTKRRGDRPEFARRGQGQLREDAQLAIEYLNRRGIDVPENPTYQDIASRWEELRTTELPGLNRDMKLIKVATASAPLWGLLGTVTGMLQTFDGLARGGGGDKTMNMIASGISQALITTETGLMVALPGYFLGYYLMRKKEQFTAFLSHLETSYAQFKLIVQRDKSEEERILSSYTPPSPRPA